MAPHTLHRSRLVASLALAALLAGCNFPTSHRLTLDEVMATMAAVTPVATATLPPAPTQDPAATPVLIERPFPSFDPLGAAFEYTTRSGDTLEALARRFEVGTDQILGSAALPDAGYLPIGQQLEAPNMLEAMSPGGDLLPDGDLVYSPTASDFDVVAFVDSAGGYLSRYSEALDDGTVLSGAAIVQRVADENSINPRLLLALLEFRSSWVYGTPASTDAIQYPIGFRIPGRSGLYDDLTVAANQLNLGYYGWRAGTMLETSSPGVGTIRWNPTLNAGSVALLRLFVVLTDSAEWQEAMIGPQGFAAVYEGMFGDPWSRAAAAGSVLPTGLGQPALELPFPPGERWSLTAGPHNAWTSGTPRGALDISPITGGDPCAVSPAWVTASAPGVVVRAADNAVALDLDGDGRESTGWVLLYYHLADDGMISPWVRVAAGDPLGHPSCQGGRATGKHVHLARKYNGEWLPADGAVPMILSGWLVVADPRNYYGSLVRGSDVVTSDSSGQQGSTIWR
jgi:murein DD-endopeptidase MepM/ murein hydrolase activator NlpD